VNSWTAPTPRKGIYSCGWSIYSLVFGNFDKTFEKFISFKPEFSMRPEYNRKLGKWTLSTHVLPVYALSLSLGMFAFDTTT
jgi:hypothetical protein